MPEQPIRLSHATSRAWARMKQVLFQPFDAGKWFVLGFTAWLATLFEGGGSSGGGGSGEFDEEITESDETSVTGTDSTNGEATENASGSGGFPWEEVQETVAEGIGQATHWIQDNPVLVALIGGILLFVFLVLFVLHWVKCRGKFMFLDNCVNNRALVAHPWSAYRSQGNSLFFWTVGFGVLMTLAFVALGGATLWYAVGLIEGEKLGGETVGILAMLALAFLGLALLGAYIGMLLEDFVVPLMYRYGLSTTRAWFLFLPTHNRRLLHFLLYALWKILLGILAVFAILAIGFGTCCIGFLLLAIPYIGAVFLLPMTTFFRFLGPEYLGQFQDEWDLFATSNATKESLPG